MARLSTVPLRVGLPAAAAGGVLGSLARYGLGELITPTTAFPWVTFLINVLGSAALAGLPVLAVVRRTPWLAVFLGTGFLGGFTTMSAASEQTVVLLDHDQVLTAFSYLAGTLVAAALAVRMIGGIAPEPLPEDAVE